MKEFFAVVIISCCSCCSPIFADDAVIDTSLVTECAVSLSVNVPEEARNKWEWRLKSGFSTQLTDGRTMGVRSLPYFLRMIEDYPMIEFEGYPDDVLKFDGACEDFRGIILPYSSERRLLYGITLGFLDTILVTRHDPKTGKLDGRYKKLLWVDCERIIMEVCRLMHAETGGEITVYSDGKVTFNSVTESVSEVIPQG